MMRPIIQQQTTTTTAVASNTSTASSSIAGNWTAYVSDTDGVTFPSSSDHFNTSSIGNNNTNCNFSQLLGGKCNQTCNSKSNNNNSNHSSGSHSQKQKIKTKSGNSNLNNNGVNTDCERKNSLTNNLEKSIENLNKVGGCDELIAIKSTQTTANDSISLFNEEFDHTQNISLTSKPDTDDESDKLNTNLECAPLIELSPSKSITLVKQNSTSLIFTKKDVNPVVHRKRITLVRSSGTNSSNDKLTTSLTEDTPIISHTNESISSPRKRHSFHWHSDRQNNCANSTDKLKRKQIKSWYAVISGGDVEKLHENRGIVACTTDSLLHNNHNDMIDDSQSRPQLHQVQHRKTIDKFSSLYRPNNMQEMGHATAHTIGSVSKYNRFEQLLKNLVGRKVSREPTSIASSLSTSSIIGNNGANLHSATTASLNTSDLTASDKKYSSDGIDFSSSSNSSRSDDFTTDNQHLNAPLLFASPDIKISRAPSAHNLFRNNEKLFTTTSSASTTSLNATMHQRLWSVVPLLRREGSSTSLNQSCTKPIIHQRHDIGLKKCETVSALTHSQTTSNFEPIKARNRLRHSQSIATCSRCSSILSLAANGSRYSLNIANGGFVPIKSNLEKSTSFRGDIANTDQSTVIKSLPSTLSLSSTGWLACKLCLNDVKYDNLFKIQHCGCLFCIDCMKAYVEFEILEGAYEISCPDALCPHQGVMDIEQDIVKLVSNDLIEKHKRFRLNREIELDKNRTWCPRAGCETVCLVEPTSKDNGIAGQSSSLISLAPVAVKCPTCVEEFCSNCKKSWHPTLTCEENIQRLAANGADDSIGIPFDSDLIKCCPMCGVPIEKDEGCAQMMCKRCKHVFCWYCLASLDDDFLLRHYDKGPCKNKLGHSRASVVWHRAQVIGIFASFGILLLVASPLLLLAAPCIVCCKCRLCSSKMEDVDGDFDDPNGPQQNR